MESIGPCREKPSRGGPARLTRSLAAVFHARRGVDLADHAPVFLVGDRHELVLALELGLERRALPRERKERLLDLLGELRIEIVCDAVAGGRERFGFVDRPDLGL